MKKPLLSLTITMLGLTAVAQDVVVDQKVTILPESSLMIMGFSNINDFDCAFDIDLLDATRELKMVMDGNTIYFEHALLALKSNGFDCGKRGINNDFKSLVNAQKYPMILLDVKEVKLNEKSTAETTLAISIAGIAHRYDVPVKITEGNDLAISGKLNLNIVDFGLEPPKKLFGLIIIKEQIEISFHLKIEYEKMAVVSGAFPE